MIISRSIDIEDAVREVLLPYLTAYCAPLPENFVTPCILVQAVGGSSEVTASGKGKVDTFTVVLDSRAEFEGDALEYLRNAVGILEASTGSSIAYVATNSAIHSWGIDPARPDLAMCSATLLITAHRETVTI